MFFSLILDARILIKIKGDQKIFEVREKTTHLLFHCKGTNAQRDKPFAVAATRCAAVPNGAEEQKWQNFSWRFFVLD